VKAAFLDQLERLVVRESAMPRAEPGGVVVRVRACSVCGSDVRSFLYGHHALTLPQILGHEIAGEVAEVGGRVPGIRKGDRVVIYPGIACGHCHYCRQEQYNRCINMKSIGESVAGGFAEYIALPAWTVAVGGLIPIPEHVPFDVASLTEPLACVLNGQDLVRLTPRDSVVIIGLGPIGCLHILAARAHGARKIIAADTAKIRVEMARSFAADVYVDSSVEDLLAVVARETDGLGADVVIVACGVAAAQAQAIEVAAKGGRISFFGGLPRNSPTATINSNRIHYNELTVVGAFGSRIQHCREAMALIASGRLPFERLITHRVPLESIEQGFQLAREGTSLRVVITP